MIIEKLNSITQRAQKNLAVIKKTESILKWIASIAIEKDRILVLNDGYEEVYSFTFPRYLNDPPKKRKGLPEDKGFTFIICYDYNDKRLSQYKKNFVPIFYSPTITLYENKNRNPENLPLRFGLSLSEKKEALVFTREVLNNLLKKESFDNKSSSQKLSARFFLHVDLDVAIWINGSLRGSHVVQNLQLFDGLETAAIEACRDRRFKPIDYAELKEARIEIALFSPLRLSVDFEEVKLDEFSTPEKGYSFDANGKRGWMLPSAFNTKIFPAFSDFITYLAESKAKINYKEIKKTNYITQFDVDNFIDDEEKKGLMNIIGGVARNFNEVHKPEEFPPPALAIKWLLSLQENDGNIKQPPNPINNSVTTFDLSRPTFAMWALTEYLNSNDEQIEKVDIAKIEKHFLYLIRQINNNFLPKTFLTYCYGALEGMALSKLTGKNEYSLESEKWINLLLNKDLSTQDPITTQQLATLFITASEYNPKALQRGIDLAHLARDQFNFDMEKSDPKNLAIFAELVNTFYLLDKQIPSPENQQFSLEVAKWLLGYKMEAPNNNTGPFSSRTDGGLPYTRGSGKIAEVLVIASKLAEKIGENYNQFSSAAAETIQWLEEMQYTSQNSYFIRPEIRSTMEGGLRYSLVNPEVWVDAVGHYLLTLSRKQS